jgi:hypothetical protein
MSRRRQQDYLAYMLRVWKARTDGGTVWRASLESPHTGERQAFADLAERQAFADLAALFAFLEERTEGFEVSSQQVGEET